MKLLDKSLLFLVLLALLIASVSSLFQYFWVKNTIEERVDYRLYKEKNLVAEQLHGLKITDNFSYETDRTSVNVYSNNGSCAESISYKRLKNSEGDLVGYRVLASCVNADGKQFKVVIRMELEETEAFFQSIFFSFLITLLIGVFALLAVKWLLLKVTWTPFFQTLGTLKEGDFQNTKIKFDENVQTKEFQDLNIELNTLSERIYEEYQSQKVFIENVNHELLTPLAVIKGKLELLIQSENLKENDLVLVSDIFRSIDRLTQLNKSLILLSKIENHQYEEAEDVLLSELLDDILDTFEDQIRTKKITLRKSVTEHFKLQTNEMLLYVLLFNLIKNAIQHNLDDQGYIEITLEGNVFEISNSGLQQNDPGKNIFNRFVKDSNSHESIGLGLSIVEKICLVSGYSIQYLNDSTSHTFRVTLK